LLVFSVILLPAFNEVANRQAGLMHVFILHGKALIKMQKVILADDLRSRNSAKLNYFFFLVAFFLAAFFAAFFLGAAFLADTIVVEFK
jgi:hypothetical protein